MAAAGADRQLLLGLLALQNRIINQAQLVHAFQAWSLDKSKSLAEHLESRGDLSGAKRRFSRPFPTFIWRPTTVTSRRASQRSQPARRLGRALRGAGGPELATTLGHVGSPEGTTLYNNDRDRTGAYAVGSATSGGQRFCIVRPHASGGLGAVFVALDTELDREVALKQIHDDRADDPTSRYRFLIEAQITGGLEHPGIVPVYGLGSYDDGRPYYAMRLIRGDSLKEAIQEFHGGSKLGKRPDGRTGTRDLAAQLLRRFMDVCNAIDYAHSRGVIHRDIKPANIILGKHGETLVVDWGVASVGPRPTGDRVRRAGALAVVGRREF